MLCHSCLEFAPVLLLVLHRAGPELDRIGAGPIFGPVPIPYLYFCVAHALKPTMLKRLNHKAINLQQLRDTWHLTVWSGLCTYRRAKLLTHTPAHMSRALLMSVKSTCQLVLLWRLLTRQWSLLFRASCSSLPTVRRCQLKSMIPEFDGASN